MSSRTSHRNAAGRALWLGGLLLTLAGLFGMHGLAGHGTKEMGTAHPAMSSMSSGVASTAGHMAQTVEATGSTVVTARTSVGPTGGMGMDMSATGMCMAVLLLSLIALLVRLHASRLRPVLFLTTRPARAPVPSGRAPDPPNLYVLSIHRC